MTGLTRHPLRVVSPTTGPYDDSPSSVCTHSSAIRASPRRLVAAKEERQHAMGFYNAASQSVKRSNLLRYPSCAAIRLISTYNVNASAGGSWTMSLIDMCKSSLEVPLSEHKDWRAALIVLQGACLCFYLAATFIHRKRIFCLPITRKWDLDHVFMALSTAAAATGVVTWVFWMETDLANVRA